MFQTLQLGDLHTAKVELLRAPSSTRPAVYVIGAEGAKAVVKDFTGNGFFYRNVIGRFLLWREKRAYQNLKGLNGTPALYRTVAGSAIILEHIPGRNLETSRIPGSLKPAFFEDLKKLVEAFHKRGVCHCDLKRAANILIGADGKPYVVDWSAAILRTEFRFYPLSLIYRRFVVDDLNAVTKYQLRHCPETVTPEALHRYSQRSRAEKAIRALRDRLRRILKKVA